MKIKVCGMTQRENLEAVLTHKPDFVGFIFYKQSSRAIDNTEVLLQRGGHTKKVGVFVNEDLSEVRKLGTTYLLDYVQLHGEESPRYCYALKMSQIKVIKTFSITDPFDFYSLKEYVPFVDYFLFDTKGEKRGGSGVKFDWRILNQYAFDIPFFLSGGIAPEDVEAIQALIHPQLYAVDINSGFEIFPGIKDAASIAIFIKKLTSKN